MSRANMPAKTNTATPSISAPLVPQEKIAMRAYEKWCKRGRPHGTNMQDWLEAEKELKAESAKGAKR